MSGVARKRSGEICFGTLLQMQRAAALQARLSDWVGESRPHLTQYSAISATLGEIQSSHDEARTPVEQLAASSKLARLAMEFNELLMAHAMSVCFRVSDDIVEWQVRKESKYWFLWEKVHLRGGSLFLLIASQTPLFWFKYLASKNREPLGAEARRRVVKLRQLQRNLTAFLGVGVRMRQLLL